MFVERISKRNLGKN